MSWKDLVQEMDGVCTAEYAEPVRHVPMFKPDVNGRAQVDPSRPEQVVSARQAGHPLTAIFEWQAHEVDLSMGHAQSRMPAAERISSRRPCLYIDVRDFLSPVRVDDRFAVLERGLVLEVVDQMPDGQGRIELRCNRIGRAP